MCLIGLMRPHWYLVLKPCVASQGYQAVAEQIRQLIFSRANGVLWIMSWASRVSSSLHFVEWEWFVYHKCLWSDIWVDLIFQASPLFVSPRILSCAGLSRILFWISGSWRPQKDTKEETGWAKRYYRSFQQSTEAWDQTESWMCSPWRQRMCKQLNQRRKLHRGQNQNLPKKPKGLFTLRSRS